MDPGGDQLVGVKNIGSVQLITTVIKFVVMAFMATVDLFYISGANQYPIPALGRWNLGVGFGLMLSGFLMTTRWR